MSTWGCESMKYKSIKREIYKERFGTVDIKSTIPKNMNEIIDLAIEKTIKAIKEGKLKID